MEIKEIRPGEIQISLEDSKFSTCTFRSDNEIEKLIKRCSCQGGDYKIKGYYCHQRNIFQLTKEICESCPVYQAK